MIIEGGEKMGEAATVIVLLSHYYSIPVLVFKCTTRESKIWKALTL
jgi:hypothetical protein